MVFTTIPLLEYLVKRRLPDLSSSGLISFSLDALQRLSNYSCFLKISLYSLLRFFFLYWPSIELLRCSVYSCIELITLTILLLLLLLPPFIPKKLLSQSFKQVKECLLFFASARWGNSNSFEEYLLQRSEYFLISDLPFREGIDWSFNYLSTFYLRHLNGNNFEQAGPNLGYKLKKLSV